MSRSITPKRPHLFALLGAAGIAFGCAEPSSPRVARAPVAPGSDIGAAGICRAIVDRFAGLPSADGAALESAQKPAPLVGRWWIRGCSIAPFEGGLRLHLDGPGWYWVDSETGNIALHQQVPFDLGVELTGRLRAAYADGVASLWLDLTEEPKVEVNASTELDLRGATAWGSFLRRIPLLPVRVMTAARLSQAAEKAFQAQLRRGITVTYDLLKGQADMTLGKLQVGETPRHAFEDGASWVANDLVSLPASATHAFGPIEPLPIELDLFIERGPGVSYMAICARDMRASWSAVAAGTPGRIPPQARLTSGTISGGGPHATQLRVDGCPYYLIVSSAGAATTVAALRLRR